MSARSPAAPDTVSGSGPSDAALVLAARAGEAWAAEALFRRHARMVNGLAYRLLGRDADVDDVVQDVFAGAFTALERLEDPQAFAGFLAAITVRTSTKTIRRRRLMRRLGLAGAAVLRIDVDALVGSHIPAEDAIELRRLYRIFERLPAELRVPLALQRVEGLPLEEVAQLCGCSLATVKRRIARADAELHRERAI